MQSLRQHVDELNRERLARARQRPPALRHVAFRTAAGRTDRGESRMSRRARNLTVAGRRPRFGVAVMLTATLLLAGTANAIAATSPAGHATVPDTVPAASPARFPDGAAKTDSAQPVERADREPAGPRALGQNTHAMAATPPAPGKRYPRAFIEWKLSAWPPQHCR